MEFKSINWEDYINFLFFQLKSGKITEEEFKKDLADDFKKMEEIIFNLREILREK